MEEGKKADAEGNSLAPQQKLVGELDEQALDGVAGGMLFAFPFSYGHTVYEVSIDASPYGVSGTIRGIASR